MPIDEQLDALCVTQRTHKSVQACRLRSIRRRGTLIGFRARIGRGAARCGIPSERPIAVDVAAEAGRVVGGRLAILAPEAICGLRVDKPVRIDER